MGAEHAKPAAPVVRLPTEVTLHVYDLDGSSELSMLNGLLRPLGTGVFHVGIEVFNKEWSFRGSHRDGTGIFSCMPGCCASLRPRESVKLGLTMLTNEEVTSILKILEADWPGRGYDILRRNCGHFTDELCRYLGVGPIPAWAKNMASAGANLMEVGGWASGLASAFGCAEATGRAMGERDEKLRAGERVVQRDEKLRAGRSREGRILEERARVPEVERGFSQRHSLPARQLPPSVAEHRKNFHSRQGHPEVGPVQRTRTVWVEQPSLF